MENIAENNKLITEFMGYVNITPTDKDFNIYEGKNKGLPNLIETNFEKRFHTDWNWLMLVAEKCLIGEAEHDEDEAKKAISEIYESLCSINISAVYKACVEFIKWYNLNNK